MRQQLLVFFLFHLFLQNLAYSLALLHTQEMFIEKMVYTSCAIMLSLP